MEYLKYLYWFKPYALRNFRKDILKIVPGGYEIIEISYFTASRVKSKEWWTIYVEIAKTGDPWNWTNNWFYYNSKTGEIVNEFNAI
ncbi:MAG: hypothetical protein WC444_05875 [Candidatus Paceibacterota bacterium]